MKSKHNVRKPAARHNESPSRCLWNCMASGKQWVSKRVQNANLLCRFVYILQIKHHCDFIEVYLLKCRIQSLWRPLCSVSLWRALNVSVLTNTPSAVFIWRRRCALLITDAVMYSQHFLPPPFPVLTCIYSFQSAYMICECCFGCFCVFLEDLYFFFF